MANACRVRPATWPSIRTATVDGGKHLGDVSLRLAIVEARRVPIDPATAVAGLLVTSRC